MLKTSVKSTKNAVLSIQYDIAGYGLGRVVRALKGHLHPIRKRHHLRRPARGGVARGAAPEMWRQPSLYPHVGRRGGLLEGSAAAWAESGGWHEEEVSSAILSCRRAMLKEYGIEAEISIGSESI